MTAVAAVPAVIERVGRVLDDRIYEHTVVRSRGGRVVTRTVQLNGWHVLGAAAVAAAALWSGFVIGALGWRAHDIVYKDGDGKEKKARIHLPAAVTKGNERLGLKPYDVVTGAWVSPLRWLFP